MFNRKQFPERACRECRCVQKLQLSTGRHFCDYDVIVVREMELVPELPGTKGGTDRGSWECIS